MTSNLLTLVEYNFSYIKTPLPEDWNLKIHYFALKRGNFILLTGDNMSGKTTFLRLLAGKEAFSEKLSASSHLGKAIFLSNADQMFPELSTWDNIRVALPQSSARNEKLIREKCTEFLGDSNIFSDQILENPLGNLSSGGRSIVKLCRAVASDRNIILVDEMTSYLDSERASFFLDFLISRTFSGDAIVLVSHSDRDRDYVKKKITDPAALQEFHIFRRRNQSSVEQIGV